MKDKAGKDALTIAVSSPKLIKILLSLIGPTLII